MADLFNYRNGLDDADYGWNSAASLCSDFWACYQDAEHPRSVAPARPSAQQQAASEFVYLLAQNADAQALDVIAALAAAAPTRRSLFYLGAGPLEDLIQGHGDKLVDAVIRLARKQPRFKITLSGVWVNEGTQLSARTLARLTPWLGDDVTTPFE